MAFNLKFNNKRFKNIYKTGFKYLYISMKARKGLKSHLIKPIVDVITIFSSFSSVSFFTQPRQQKNIKSHSC